MLNARMLRADIRRWCFVIFLCCSYLFTSVHSRTTKRNELELPRQTITLSPFLTNFRLRILFPLLLGIGAKTAALLPIGLAILAGVGIIFLLVKKTFLLTSFLVGAMIWSKVSSKFGGLSGILGVKNNNDSHMSGGAWPAPQQHAYVAPPQPQPGGNSYGPPAQPAPQQSHQPDYWRNERSEPNYDGYRSVFTYR